jgi:acetyltransferase-like isoleucine patch superfamily enzyme
MNGHTKGRTTAPIRIGKNNWITNRCIILKGAATPDYCILGTGSVLTKDYSNLSTHILLAGNPLEIKTEGI